jgi:NAD(P)-dependent dehydrogenase (short-subunit alcohol dehydrogenase family)
MRLKDKVALLIGCSPNIGRSIARIFAKEGASVVVDDIKEKEGMETVAMIEKAGGKAVFTSADISTSQGLKDAVSCTIDNFGKVDIFVSLANALQGHSVAEFNRSTAELCYAVNVLALIEGAHYCLPHMKKTGGGSIIAVSSIQGFRGTGGNPGYAAAKAGLTGAAQTMAVELWQHKIRVNVIYPSGVGGPTWNVIDQLGWDYIPEFEEKFGAEMRHLPLIVGIDPIALGYAALFLASEESNYITGVTLPVDAGTSIMHCDVYKGFPPCETPERKNEYQRELYKKYKEWIEEKKSEINKTGDSL